MAKYIEAVMKKIEEINDDFMTFTEYGYGTLFEIATKSLQL